MRPGQRAVDDLAQDARHRVGDLAVDDLLACGLGDREALTVAVGHRQDRDRLAAHAVVGERGVGRRHRERRDLVGAEGEGRVALHRLAVAARDPERRRGLRRGALRGLLLERHEVGVDGERRAGEHVERARAGRVVDVVGRQRRTGLAVLEVLERRVLRRLQVLVRRQALLQRRGERERLERRSRLRPDAAAVLRADVEVVRRAADALHAPVAVLRHRHDLPGVRDDHRDGRELAAPVATRDVLVDRALRGPLRLGDEGRADGEAATSQQLVARRGCLAERGVGAQLAVDVVAEERRVGGRAAVAHLVRLEELLGRDRRVRRRERGADVAEVGHPVEHLAAALLRRLRVARRVVGDRLLHRAREGRGLDEGQLAGVLGEVAQRGGLDAVGTGAEVGDVEVALEDLVLGEDPFEGQRVAHLLELADVGARACGRGLLGGGGALDEHVLDVLLREGRATATGRRGAAGRVADEGADDAARVDAAVLVEATVLDRDDRLAHDRRDRGQRHLDAVLLVDRREHGAVGGEDARALRQRRRGQLRGQRLVALDGRPGGDAGPADERQGRAGHEHAGHEAHQHEEAEAREGRHEARLARCRGGARRGGGGRHRPTRVRRGDASHGIDGPETRRES